MLIYGGRVKVTSGSLFPACESLSWTEWSGLAVNTFTCWGHLSRPFASLLWSSWQFWCDCGRLCVGSGPALYPHGELCRKESFFTAFWTSPEIFWLNNLGHMLTPIDIQGLGWEEKVEIKCTPYLKPSKSSWELEEQCGGRVDKWMDYQAERMHWERMLNRHQTMFLMLSQLFL